MEFWMLWSKFKVASSITVTESLWPKGGEIYFKIFVKTDLFITIEILLLASVGLQIKFGWSWILSEMLTVVVG